jgi:hypothetical protein
MMARLILVGCGAFARELINWVDDLVDHQKSIPVSGFIDNSPDALIGFSYAVPYLGKIQSYIPQPGDQLLMAIGDPKVKKKLFFELKEKGASFSQLIHLSAVVARTACSEVYLEKAFDGTGWRPEMRLPVAKELGETSLMFLVHPTLTDGEIKQTCDAIEQVMKRASA